MPIQSSSQPECAERISVGGDEITFRVTTAATQGALLAVDVAMPAGGGPPALHRHDPEEIYACSAASLPSTSKTTAAPCNDTSPRPA